VEFLYRPVDFILRTASRIQSKEEFLRQGVIRFSVPSSMKEFIADASMIADDPFLQRRYVLKSGTGEADLKGFQAEMIFSTFRDLYRTDNSGASRMSSWFNDDSGTTHMWRNLLKAQTSLYKYEMTAAEAPGHHLRCAGCETQWEARAREGFAKIIETTLGVADVVTLSAEDQEALALVRRTQYYGNGLIAGPIDLFTQSSVRQEMMGLLDEPFTFLTSIRLGFNPLFRDLRTEAEVTWYPTAETNAVHGLGGLGDGGTKILTPSRTDKFAKAEAYAQSLKDESNLMYFKLDEDLLKIIRDTYLWNIEGDLKLAESFVGFAEEWSRQNQAPDLQFSTLAAPIRPSVLNPHLVQQYNYQIRRFQEASLGVF
jgi:hypothetical protein